MSDSGMQLALRKRELRAEMAAKRDGLSAERRTRLSAEICRHAWQWFSREGADSLLAYAPFRSELDCRPLLAEAWAAGHEVLLPRVIRDTGTMDIHAVRSWEELVPGTYGIPEPAAGASGPDRVAGLPDVVFVPGLAFDLRGGRLGYGRGYYDRLRAAWEEQLQDSAVRPLWAGLAYDLQRVYEVPLEAHDALMDLLITENGIWDCRKERASWN